jgi:hypothetical protein
LIGALSARGSYSWTSIAIHPGAAGLTPPTLPGGPR